jgi:L-iditol 2-dehydrogenase
MTAAVLHGINDLRVEEVPIPSPGPGQVLVRVVACGVCGSDLPRVKEKGTYRFPLIPGHEFAGTIAALGEGATGWREGERVVVFPLLPCFRCPSCRARIFECCDDYDYLGSRSDGAFAEYVAAPVWNLVRVPDDVPLECAAMAEPAAVARHALGRFDITPETIVAVFGAGPIGVMVAQWASALGAPRVWIVDLVPEKLAVAASITEATCVDAKAGDAVEAILADTDGQGVALAVEAAGVPITARQALKVARKQGGVVLLGNPAADLTLPQAEVSQVLRKQLTIRGTWNSSFLGAESDQTDDWRDALSAMADGRLNLQPLITHRFPLSDAPRVFDWMAGREEFFNKVMFATESG